MHRSLARYKAKHGALVAFSIPDLPSIATMRRLVDISRGGLAFQYLSADKQKLTSARVDLFWFNSLEPVVAGLPCRIVYDIGENSDVAKRTQFRRCGLQFEGLSKEQEAELAAFIENYAQLEAYPRRDAHTMAH